MSRRKTTTKLLKKSGCLTSRGFTLAEMIVVIAIIAIVAAAGIATAIGYINHSKFEKNSQHAITVYQTAQTALAKKTANGTVRDWLNGFPGIDDLENDPDLEIPTDSGTDYSVHKTVSLTYNPESDKNSGEDRKEDDYLFDLLSSYFYDRSIFSGTITVEFDICKTKNNELVDYSVTVISAFYSVENDYSSGGWDAKCIHGSADGLPDRSDEYRQKTSYVGYYNGHSDGTLPGSVSSVAIPWDDTRELEGHIVGPTEDGSQAIGYLFNIRNAETLNVSWAIFDDNKNSENESSYTYSAHEDHNEDLYIILTEYGKEIDSGYSVTLHITHESLMGVSYGEQYTTYEAVDDKSIVRRSWSGLIRNVEVTKKNGSKTTMAFPITKSLVTGDDRTGCPVEHDKGYYEYAIVLDAMMDSSSSNVYGIERLFGDKTPRNIYATLGSNSQWEYTDENNLTKTKTIVNTNAARAINDPVYLTGSVTRVEGHLANRYSVEEYRAQYDFPDSAQEEYVITGTAIFNTYFGDKVYAEISGAFNEITRIGGTSWSSSAKEAVLTNCRHLYNIRWMPDDTSCYRIVSDINWYIRSDNDYLSDVKVFTSESFHSPVPSDADYAISPLRIVSFPAIGKLPANATLTSISDSDKKVCSINNFQLRAESFNNVTANQGGYGLICINEGLIYNTYIDNMSLILTSVPDGSESDYTGTGSDLCPSGTVSVSKNNSSVLNNNPVGALVGRNKGIMGSSTESDESINTVCVTNSVVLAGNYWKYGDYDNVGGVIGKNDATSSAYGLIRVGGHFAVLGKDAAGGIIGSCVSDISARLEVDGFEEGNGKSEFSLPNLISGKSTDCAVIANVRAGGAIGSFEGKSFNRTITNHYSYSITNSTTGELSFDKLDKKDYHIHVVLPSDSIILHLGGGDKNTASAGGVIGYLSAASGNYLSIYTDIAGYIVSEGTSVESYCGGVIGREIDCSIKDVYLDCGNAYGSVIGSTSDGEGAVSSGGAYGRINTKSDYSSRKIAINVYNDGTIRSRGSGNGFGSGGAIGGASNYFKISLIVKAFNYTNSNIIGTGNNIANHNGTGGAIGGLGDTNSDDTMLSQSTHIYVDNRGTISGKNHVGGAVGNTSKNYGKVFAVNSGKINGSSFVGGAVGRAFRSQFGTVQSILSGATIKGYDFVGGAVGRVLYFQNNAVIRTIVKSYSEVDGEGNLVGGVCGDVLLENGNTDGVIELKGDSTNPVIKISGGDDDENAVGVGGVAGILRLRDEGNVNIVLPEQNDLNRLAMHIDGQNDIGGAVGRLVCNDKADNVVSTIISGTSKDCNLELDVVLNPQTYILGTGQNVGGAVGNILYSGGKFTGHIKVTSVYGSNTDASLIRGDINVGGAVGYFCKSLPQNSGSSEISVDFTRSPWTIEGTAASGDSNVGGAVGHFFADKPSVNVNVYFPITVKLGTSTVTSSGSNVGGAVGFNENSLLKSDFEVRQEVNGTISGNENVGGIIGKNQLTYSYGSLHDFEARINGTVSGNGKNVGGAIGYNLSSLNNIVTYINGTVTGKGDNVGGAIGNCASVHRDYKLNIISSYIQGSGRVIGKDSVGGTIGFNESNIYEIDASISGNSKVIGEDCVGGALGYASSVSGQTGTNILALANDKCYGRILKVNVVISADYALSGKTKLGGAIGRIGDKTNGTVYNSACVVNVQTTLNSAYLFDPETTGTDKNSNACIGGIIGIFIDGRLGVDGGGVNGEVVLKGTGGVVNTSKYVDTQYYPARTFSNSVFIGASGCSIGGLVGQIGIAKMQQNVCLANISVDKGPNLVVVSLNGSDRIGGWIGSGYAAHGGIGNNNSGEYNSSPVKYDVKNVKAVISIGGSEIGGFCGRTDADNGGTSLNQVGTYAKINVDLSDASVIGTSKVGGAIGEAYDMYFANGGINVKLSNYSNIGDMAGNALPGDTNEYTPICYYAGGAIACVEGVRKDYNTFQIPVIVTIDATSRICGLGDIPAGSDVSGFGVGGVFGTCDAKFNSSNSNQVVRVTSEDGSIAAVQSKNANVGGVVGVLVNNSFTNASANVTVQLNSGAENLYIGGIVGRVKAGTIDKCHFGPDAEITKDGYFDAEITRKGYFDNSRLFGEGAVYDAASYRVISNGASSFAGGFMGGSDGSVTISNCYSTASVLSDNGDSTGGFAGKVSTGTISKSYVGGHTYSKHYIAGSGDITGAGNVGGFVGKTTGNITFDNCYSTASVLGTGSYVGGFVGYRNNNSTIKNSYCTGSVISSDEATTGAFAGYSAKTNYTNSCAMTGINALPLAGNVPGTETITNLTYKDAASIKGTNKHAAHSFDGSLGTEYGLRAVIEYQTSKYEHWGDWPVVTGAISITNLTIDLTPDSFEYSKSGYHLEDFLTIMHDDYELIYGQDYTLTYSNATKAGDNAKVIISGINNYDGAVSLPFTITRASIVTADVTVSYPEGITDGFEYNGADHIPVSTVKLGEDTLVEGRDYHLEYSPNNRYIGTVTVKVVGDGNYKDEIDNAGTFEIIGRNLADAEVTLLNATEEELVYDGNPKEPGVIVRIDGKTLERDVDYRVEYVSQEFQEDEDPDKKYNHTDVGTVIVLILPCEGNEEYTGKNDKTTFDITKATNIITQEPSISGWIWSYPPNPLTNELKAKFGEPNYYVYTDANCKTNLVVDAFAADDMTDDTSTAYNALINLDAGDYYLLAKVEDNKNFTDVSKIVPFTIDKADITDLAVVTLEYEKIPYTGESLTPEVISVVFNGRTLAAEDYTVKYDTDTTNPGTKTVTVTGQRNCYGSVTAEYIIQPVWTVTFDAGDGTISDTFENPVKVTDGETVAAPDEEQISYEGYKFIGWYSNSLLVGDPYDFSTPVTADMTLYAKWIQLMNVTFVLYDDVNLMTQQVPYGGTMERPEDPTREGYDFVGWFIDDNNEWTNFDASITKDYILYAHWTPQVHTVTFDTNGGTLIPDQTLTYGEDALAKPADPEYNDGTNDYRFDGWFTDEECTDEFTDFDSYIAEDMTLHAKWTKLWNVTLVLYDGVDNVVVKIGDQENLDVPSEALSREYYSSDVEWFTDSGLESAWETGPIDDNLTLYAKWTAIEYTVAFDTNGGPDITEDILSQKVSIEKELEEPVVPHYKGYRFDGWFTDPECNDEDRFDEFGSTYTSNLTLYAKWTKAWRVTLKLYDGQDDLVLYVEEGQNFVKPADPDREHYTFDGWFTDSSCTTAWTGFNAPLTDDLTLYAKWKDE